MTQGKRRDLNEFDGLPLSGEYGIAPGGNWYGCAPVSPDEHGFILTADLSKHEVVEHEDGTITVSPSILIRRPHAGAEWHGYLERGVWRKV